MRRVFIVVAIIAFMFAIAFVATAIGAPTSTPKVLHVGSTGKRVKALQWLLSGHDPSHYRSIKTYRGKIDGHYGKKTANAVWNMKYQLGYPLKQVNKTAGDQLFQILKGKQPRPIQWIAVAAKRLSQVKHPVYPSAVSVCQRKIQTWAYSQVGVYEYPFHSNTGPGISYWTSRTNPSFQSITGAYGAPWCVSFAQWVLFKAGHGPIADRTAGVFYMREWAYRRGYLRSRPEPGAIVLYLWSTGHAGVVVKVTQNGFWTVEGNYSDSVAHVYHPFSRSAIAFVYLPGCS